MINIDRKGTKHKIIQATQNTLFLKKDSSIFTVNYVLDLMPNTSKTWIYKYIITSSFLLKFKVYKFEQHMQI